MNWMNHCDTDLYGPEEKARGSSEQRPKVEAL